MNVVTESPCLLRCPHCELQVFRVWVTTLNKAFSPQVRAVEPLGHVVAVAAKVDGRQLLMRCPQSLSRELRPTADGPVGVRELDAQADEKQRLERLSKPPAPSRRSR